MMTGDFFSDAPGVSAAVGNHLWQSTGFAAAVWMVTLLLRKNQAQVRYGLWLASSVKFLVPFSLLIGLGGLVPQPQPAAIGPPPNLYAAVAIATQPFSEKPLPPTDSRVPVGSLRERLTAWLPVGLAAGWLCGVVAVLQTWHERWRKVAAALRRALPVTCGRELEILRRLENLTKARTLIPVVRSAEMMEPGIFGIVRPVLIWPERLSEVLEDEHLQAILAHEMTHARHRDNLIAALHMAVEAVFWFHPMVWWMGRRMVEERERACDEAVVQLGSKPDLYAESLLKVCRFCVESPLACVSGITGADLNKRIRTIMTIRLVKLGLMKKLALGGWVWSRWRGRLRLA
jgi:bla regulator protein BlaR1